MSKLLFNKPARNWYEALPIGDGKTAVMVYGGKNKETLCFNDATLWSGYPRNYNNPNSVDALKKVRALILEGKYTEASCVVESEMHGDYSDAYMPLAKLVIKVIGKSKGLHKYSRTLDMTNGIMLIDDGLTTRTTFVSHPKNLAVYSISSQNPISYLINGSSLLKYTSQLVGDMLTVSGVAPDYAAPHYLGKMPNPIKYDEGKGMAYALAVKLKTDGAISERDGWVSIVGATYLCLYSATETGFAGYDQMPSTDVESVKNAAIDRLAVVNGMTFEQVRDEHIADYRSLFDKETLSLSQGDGCVPKLLRKARLGKLTAELVNLLYDYGKYMTICGSRDAQPLNLQGIWNAELRPPWSSNLTTNINAEMNYWGASRAGLEECINPFYNAVKELVQNGKVTAQTNYGARGFCVNHNVDIWRMTSPVQGDPSYMYSPLCGAWLAAEMFEHKRNSGNIDEDAVNVVSEAARFILDYLYDVDGTLVICPSVSPETAFATEAGRSPVGMSSAFELGIVRTIFADCLLASNDELLKEEIVKALSRLAPFEKAENGIAEWAGGKMSIEKGHRHFSPLYAVYPSNVIEEGCDEYDWAKQLYYYRKSNSNSPIGWSAAWSMCLASRFHDKKAVENVLKAFAARSIMNNLFDYHPPRFFQIDGNFGYMAAVHEMILREYKNGKIELLPALPLLIKDGKVDNIVVRGIKVSFEWKGGKVIEVSADKHIEVIDSNLAENVKISGGAVVIK